MDCSLLGSSAHGISKVRILGMGCHFLLQGIFPTQGTNPHFLCLLHCRQILYLLNYWGSPFLTFVSAKSLQLCPTLCDPMDCSLLGSSVHGISQARILEWVASFLLQGIFWT